PTGGPPQALADTETTSAPMAAMSSGMNGAADEASTTTSAPALCAVSAILGRSGRVPTAPEAAVMATTLVRAETSSSYCQAGSSHVSMSISAQRTVPPERCAARCHGETLAGWSSRDTTT